MQRNESSQGLPIVVARNEPVTPAAPNETARPSNKEIENLVVALVAYYEAGDAERLVGLVDGGFWSNNQSRNTYAEFFRATKSRRLWVERLAWNGSDGPQGARRSEVLAEYFDRAPRRRADLEMDIVMHEERHAYPAVALPDAR